MRDVADRILAGVAAPGCRADRCRWAPTSLVDGNSLTYRAFFALPTDMATASGQVTNAVFGFTSMLINLMKDHRPDGVAGRLRPARADVPPRGRAAYKAQREAAPDILRQQMGLVREVVDALGIAARRPGRLRGRRPDRHRHRPPRRAPATTSSSSPATATATSSSRTPHVKVLYNKRGVSATTRSTTRPGIVERTGVTPAQYPQYAALRGDPVDNLPGVPGRGGEDGGQADHHLRRPRRHLRARRRADARSCARTSTEHEDRARKNLELMVLRRDAPLDVDPDDLARDAERRRGEAAVRLPRVPDPRRPARRGAVGDAVRRSTSDPSTSAPSSSAEVTTASSAGAGSCGALGRGDARRRGRLGRRARPQRRSPGIAVVVDAVDGRRAVDPRRRARRRRRATRRSASARRPAWRTTCKPLMRSLLELDVEVRGLTLDTAIAAYLIDPAEARYALRRPPRAYTEARPAIRRRRRQRPARPRRHVARRRRAGRSRGPRRQPRWPSRSWRALEAQGMAELYDTIENPLVRVLAKMEHVGIGVDVDELRGARQATVRRGPDAAGRSCARWRAATTSTSTRRSSCARSSTTSAAWRRGKKTKTGFSTDAATLEKLQGPVARVHRAAAALPRGREAPLAPTARACSPRSPPTAASTPRSTRPWPAPAGSRPTSRTCTTSRCAPRRAASSARRSSRRRATMLLVADYNQIELRCIAHLAEDPGLIEAFTSGQDIHNATAARVFGVDPASVTVEQRSKAKMVSYGLAYGMEAYGLGQRLNIPTEEAAVILDAYFVAFPNVKDYMDRTVIEARERGYTETLFGRRRPIPELIELELPDPPGGGAPGDERRHPGPRRRHLQGGAGRLDAALVAGGYDSRLVLQVHDEVIVEVPDERARRRRRSRRRAHARCRRTRRAARSERVVG